ncbi:hypothetical protein GCWU000341_02217 [Oribacterium sp. oral taxon 078 str. F0262]|nr:hypothetical protein GCWU000341_02217 [Oribacterium sp. oral taxon 078 str. F0262]
MTFSLFPSPSGISVLQMMIVTPYQTSKAVSVPFGDIGSSNQRRKEYDEKRACFRPLRGYRFFKYKALT